MSSRRVARTVFWATTLMVACARSASATPIALLEYVESDLGGGRFRYDYTLTNGADPVVDAGADIYDVTVESAGNTFSDLALPSGWDGFGGAGFALFFAPPGLELTPGASLGGFGFEVDGRIGAATFVASFTNPDDPANPLTFAGVASPAAASPVPEPSTIALVTAGFAGFLRRRRAMRTSVR